MENIRNFKHFKSSKNTLNEDVMHFGDNYRIRGFDVPVSLVNAYKKKAKDSGHDIGAKFADTEIAELISEYVQNTFLVIDNLPLSIVGLESQPVIQTQSQVQDDTLQGGQDIQTQVQPTQTQQTAQEIPQTQTQPQGTQVQTGQGQGVQVQTGQGQGTQGQEI